MLTNIKNIKYAFFFCIITIISVTACQEGEKKTSEVATPDYQVTTIPFYRGPYQDNGGSPWHAILGLGGNQQMLRFGMDTGNNANWATSTQCNTPACTQPGRTRFNYETSKTFSFVNTNIDTLSFGPWGKMAVNTGQDVFQTLSPNSPSKFLLSVNYNGEKFDELDWDGGIGFPSNQPDDRTTWLLNAMINQGLIDPNNVYLSFYMDPTTSQGNVMIGGYDLSKVDQYSKLTFDFQEFAQDGLGYLWTTPLSSWSVAGIPVASNKVFCFDTGASDFKGDTSATNAARGVIDTYYAANGTYPNMELNMGVDKYGRLGNMILTSDQYVNMIEAGPGEGTEMISIDTLNIDNLVLVGSVLLESVYTVFKYEASGYPGNYTLTPIEIWMYNKANGPNIIQNRTTNPSD